MTRASSSPSRGTAASSSPAPLAGIDGETVLITDKGEHEHRLPFAGIASAKLVLTDRLITATAPLSTDGADSIEETDED